MRGDGAGADGVLRLGFGTRVGEVGDAGAEAVWEERRAACSALIILSDRYNVIAECVS